MSDRGFERLVPPPRSVPLALRLWLLFAGLQQIGFLLLLFSTPFVWTFVAEADVSWLYFRGSLSRVSGTVVRVHETRASEGRSRIQAIEYAFAVPGGGERHGRSYATGFAPSPGERVVVEFPEGRPELSRIEGMRRSVFGSGALVVLVFPAVGLGIAAFGVRGGARRARVLARGAYAEASLVSKQETNVRVSQRPVIAMTFEFSGLDGQRHEVVERTTSTQDLEDEVREKILYDVDDPKQAVFADSLPSAVRVDDMGQLAAPGFGSVVALLALPALVVAANAFAAWLKRTL